MKTFTILSRLRFTQLFSLSLFPLFLAIVGCSNDTFNQAGIRFFNASPTSAELSARLGDDTTFRAINYGAESGFISVDQGETRIRIEERGNPVPVIDVTRTLNGDTQYSYFIAGQGATRRGLLVEDDRTPPSGDFGAIRFGHLAPAAAAVSVYIAFPNQSIEGLTPVVTSLNTYSFSRYFEVPSGTYEIVVTERRSGAVQLRTGRITVERQSISTAVVLDSEGGGTPLQGALLIDR